MKKVKRDTSHYLRLLVKTSFIVFISIFISKIFSYVYKIIIARQFGPEPYGLFSLAAIISGLVVTFSMLGLSEGLTRFVPYYRGKKEFGKINYIVKTTLIVTLIATILTSVLLYFLADTISVLIFHDAGLSIYLKIISFVGPFAALSSVFLPLIRGFERAATYSMLINVLQNGSKLLLLILFVYMGLGANSITLSYLFAYILLALASYWLGKGILKSLKAGSSLKEDDRKKVTSELITYSWPLIFVGLLFMLFYWTDSLVLGYFKDAAIVGIYNAAITLVSLFGVAPDLFMQLFLPLIISKYSENKRTMIKDLTKQVSKWIYMINLPLFMILLAFPGVVINFFFGPEFLAAEMPLRILAFGALSSGFLSLVLGLVSMRGDSKTILKGYATFGIINLILDIILVKFWGMNGAAIATAIVWILFNLSFTIIIKKRLGFFPYKKVIVKITLVTAVLLAALLVLESVIIPTITNLIIVGASFAVAYALLILLTGCLDKHDWMILKAILEKAKSISGIKLFE